MSEKVLVVDDENLIRWSLRKELEREGYQVFEAKNAKEAIEMFSLSVPEIVLLDMKLPDDTGLNVLKKIKEMDESATVIIITAYGSITNAVEAMKLNASDYITKPFDLEEVKIVVKKASQTGHLKRQVDTVYRKQQELFSFERIIGVSEKMRKIIEVAKKVAESQAKTILIEGESGTGKDLLARAIHYNSPRKFKPFMDINCASIPDTLIESELFGYEKGAFTDAKTSKKGLFELADGGTVFLDEVTEMSLSSQAKLLKAIETGSFKRLGGVRDISVDVRVISSTNRKIEDALKDGKLRDDLYYRLNLIRIFLPPLRERKEDIPHLVNYFISTFNREFKKNVKGIHEKALKMLMEYHWPGNVRELKNVIERAVILESEDIILPEHLVIETKKKSMICFDISIPDEGVKLEEVEKHLIMKVLEKTGGNKSLASKLLGISRDTLRYRLKKYGLEDEEENGE